MRRGGAFKRAAALLTALLAVSAAALFALGGRPSLAPWTRAVALEAPSSLTALPGGDYLAIDKGSRRVLRLDGTGRVTAVLNAGSDPDRSFQYVLAAAGGADGLWLRDVVWRENGMDVDRERIFFCGPSGEKLRAVYTLEGPTGAEVRHRPRLYGPFLTERGPCFGEAEGDGLTLRSLPDGGVLRTVPYPGAENDLSDCAMDETGRLYLVDKRGLVLAEEPSGGFEELYAGGGSLGAACSVPWDAAAAGGACVFADLGSRTIRRVTADGPVTVVDGPALWGSGRLRTAPILYQVDLSADGRVCLARGDGVYAQGPGGTPLLEGGAFPLSAALRAEGWAACAALVLVLASGTALAAGVAVLALRRFRPGPGTKLGALVLLCMLIAAMLVSSIIFQAEEDRYVERIFLQMESTARNTARQLEPEDIAAVQTPGDYDSPAYRRLRAELESAVDRSFAGNQDLYCNVYLERDGVLFSPVYLDRTTGAFYPLEDEGQREVMKTGRAKRFYMTQTSSGTWMYVFTPLYDGRGGLLGVVDVGMDMDTYRVQMGQLRVKVLLSVLSACVVVQLLAMQGIKLSELRRQRLVLARRRPPPAREPVGVLRPIVFLLFFGLNLLTTFLPNYCARFGAALPGVPPALLAALPVSLNLLSTACGSFASGLAIDALGVRTVGAGGAALAAGAYLGVACSGGYPVFLLCMALSGAGLGAALNAVNVRIAAGDTPEERSEGFSVYNSAYFSGVNCGAVVGGALASALGERAVFGAAGLCLVLPGVLAWRWLGDEAPRPAPVRREKKRGGLGALLPRPRQLAFLLLGYVPYMISGHFMFYFLPIFAEKLGLDATAVSQLLLLNGVCVLLLSRFSSALFLGGPGHGSAVRSALLLVGGGFLLFSVWHSVAGLLFTVLLLGLADSFGRSAMSLYFSEGELCRRCGSRAMGVFSLFENVGETAGPMVFSFLAAGSLGPGFRLLALVYGGCALVCVPLTRRDKFEEKGGGRHG